MLPLWQHGWPGGIKQQHYSWVPPVEASIDWAQARSADKPQQGEIQLLGASQVFVFEWSSFWNQDELMVLLRLKHTPTQFAFSSPHLEVVAKRSQVSAIIVSV